MELAAEVDVEVVTDGVEDLPLDHLPSGIPHLPQDTEQCGIGNTAMIDGRE